MNAQRSKYNVSKDSSNRTYDGIVFDSVLEKRFYVERVLPRLESGELTKCDLQVKYLLQERFNHNGKTMRPIHYVADFVVTEASGHQVVIDTKGVPDSVAKIKRKLFLHANPQIDFRWIGYSKVDGGWVDYEVIQAGRRKRRKEKKVK